MHETFHTWKTIRDQPYLLPNHFTANQMRLKVIGIQFLIACVLVALFVAYGAISISISNPTNKAMTSSPPLKICQYSFYCKTDADCVPGNFCNTTASYSQCVPDPSTLSTKPGCISNRMGMCSSSKQCCDPGAFCAANSYFSQCQQPIPGTGKCLDPNEPTKGPSASPCSVRPSLLPS